MSLVQRIEVSLEARETNGGFRFGAVVGALGLSLLTMQNYAADRAEKWKSDAVMPRTLKGTPDTNNTRDVLFQRDESAAVLQAIAELHTNLAAQQRDFTSAERAAIYGNLWELYD